MGIHIICSTSIEARNNTKFNGKNITFMHILDLIIFSLGTQVIYLILFLD